jgi:hypothetical protein
MKIRGLLIVLLLGMVVVYFIYFAKTGKKGMSYIETTVDAHARMSAELTRTNLSTLARAIEFFAGTEGRFPDDLNELAKARILGATTTDAWGRPIRYEKISDSSFRLTSLGQDGRLSTSDDIVLTR